MSKKRLQMQGRRHGKSLHGDTKRKADEALHQAVKEWADKVKPFRINQYTCDTCGGVITTIDRDDGVTPFFLRCRATDGCEGTMKSSMYRVPPWIEPTHEWYKPDTLPKDPGMRQHVEQGGLLIRKIEA